MKGVIPAGGTFSLSATRSTFSVIDEGPFEVSLCPEQDAGIMFQDKYAIELIFPVNQ
jgi:hypothetical protein